MCNKSVTKCNKIAWLELLDAAALWQAVAAHRRHGPVCRSESAAKADQGRALPALDGEPAWFRRICISIGDSQ
jgi:hypothetical protein